MSSCMSMAKTFLRWNTKRPKKPSKGLETILLLLYRGLWHIFRKMSHFCQKWPNFYYFRGGPQVHRPALPQAQKKPSPAQQAQNWAPKVAPVGQMPAKPSSTGQTFTKTSLAASKQQVFYCLFHVCLYLLSKLCLCLCLY